MVSKFKEKQQGMALLISLVLLVMALLLSLSSMQGSRMDESMSGNHRASARALMGAEYGLSKVVGAITSTNFEQADASYFFGALGSERYFRVQGEPDVYYMIKDSGSSGGLMIRATAVGEVRSGAALEDGRGPREISGELLARREIDFALRLKGLGDLSPENFAGEFCSYDGARSNAADAEGEEDSEVDGLYSPAISASSYSEARKIVESILEKKQNPGNFLTYVDSNGKGYEFSGSNLSLPSGYGDVGVFHARGVVALDADNNATVNYSNACGNNNPMCNYKGGISTTLGAAILTNPDALHRFISEVFNSGNVVYHDSLNKSFTAGPDGDQVNVVTNKQHHVAAESILVQIPDGEGGGQKLETHAPVIFSNAEKEGVDGEGESISDTGVRDISGHFFYNFQEGRYDFYEFGEGESYPDVAEGEAWEYDLGSLQAVFYNEVGGVDQSRVDDLDIYSALFALDGAGHAQEGYLPNSIGAYTAQVDTSDGGYSLMLLDDADSLDLLESDPNWYSYALEGAGEPAVTPKTLIEHDGDVVGIQRDVFTAGGNNFSGDGLLIVDGSVDFQGHPTFYGIIIILGDYDLSGGGTGAFEGAIIASPYFYNHHHPDGPRLDFQCVNVDVDGGGNHDYVYDFDAISHALMSLTPEAYDLWVKGNDDQSFRYELYEIRESRQ